MFAGDGRLPVRDVKPHPDMIHIGKQALVRRTCPAGQDAAVDADLGALVVSVVDELTDEEFFPRLERNLFVPAPRGVRVEGNAVAHGLRVIDNALMPVMNLPLRPAGPVQPEVPVPGEQPRSRLNESDAAPLPPAPEVAQQKGRRARQGGGRRRLASPVPAAAAEAAVVRPAPGEAPAAAPKRRRGQRGAERAAEPEAPAADLPAAALPAPGAAPEAAPPAAGASAASPPRRSRRRARQPVRKRHDDEASEDDLAEIDLEAKRANDEKRARRAASEGVVDSIQEVLVRDGIVILRVKWKGLDDSGQPWADTEEPLPNFSSNNKHNAVVCKLIERAVASYNETVHKKDRIAKRHFQP
jgi:hypothetical protein